MILIATPKYLAIAEVLQGRILDGTLAPGERFPTLEEIKTEFDVAEGTAHQAMRFLRDKGLITTKAGAQARVRDRPAMRRMVRSWYRDAPGGSPWRADMAAQGRAGTWESHSEQISAPPAVAERLGIGRGEKVMRTQYTFFADGEPIYLSTSWEPLSITLGTPIVLPEDGPYAGAGVQDRMAAIGMAPDHSTEEPAANYSLSVSEAERLRLPAGVGALLIRRTYWRERTALETADIVIPDTLQVCYEIPIG